MIVSNRVGETPNPKNRGAKMAIFRAETKSISRGQGHNLAAAISYRAGIKLTDTNKINPKPKQILDSKRDPHTADMFTIDGLNDKQLGRIVRNPAFMAEYNHLVSPTSAAGQSQQGWDFEMVNRLKKDASQFNKRPIKDYLEY